jgi:hypothetical protein
MTLDSQRAVTANYGRLTHVHGRSWTRLARQQRGAATRRSSGTTRSMSPAAMSPALPTWTPRCMHWMCGNLRGKRARHTNRALAQDSCMYCRWRIVPTSGDGPQVALAATSFVGETFVVFGGHGGLRLRSARFGSAPLGFRGPCFGAAGDVMLFMAPSPVAACGRQLNVRYVHYSMKVIRVRTIVTLACLMLGRRSRAHKRRACTPPRPDALDQGVGSHAVRDPTPCGVQWSARGIPCRAG